MQAAHAYSSGWSKSHASSIIGWKRFLASLLHHRLQVLLGQAVGRMKSMLYQAYQNHVDMTQPWRSGAGAALSLINRMPVSASDKFLRRLAAAFELIERSRLTYARPAYGIDKVTSGNREYEIIEKVEFSTPFGSLLHFIKDGAPEQPKILLVAPMSGHFATLLRNTVKTLLQDHDVYITDWHNPRDIPLGAGVFGLDDYTEHLITFLSKIGPRAHMVAICQPSVSALVASTIMCEDDHPQRPASLTLMAGPIDTRISPTKVNEFATSKPLSWFEQNMINYVPMQCAGAFRKVYPGFIQVTAFMTMNLERHMKAHIDLMDHLAKGEIEKADTIKTFYDEYFAVMDLPADFYIETIRDVFQQHLLPQGKMMYRGRKVDPKAMRRMGLMTVEGEKDDICSIGQTVAAQDLCTGVRAYRKVHHMQAGVGHYGVFSGRKWNNEIYPLLRDFVHVNS